MLNLFKDGMNPLLALRIAQIQMSIVDFQRNMSEYLRDEKSIKENKNNITEEFKKIDILSAELQKIKAPNKDIVTETQNLGTYLVMLKERVKYDLEDLEDNNRINDLIELGNICRVTVEGVDEIIADKKKNA